VTGRILSPKSVEDSADAFFDLLGNVGLLDSELAYPLADFADRECAYCKVASSAYPTRRRRPGQIAAVSKCSKRATKPALNLLDDRVGECEQLVWNIETKRLRGLKIDYQLELGRLLNGQIRNAFASEDSSYIFRSGAIKRDVVG
jgi:hypothetical protein